MCVRLRGESWLHLKSGSGRIAKQMTRQEIEARGYWRPVVTMFVLVVFAPLLHGPIGWLDELELIFVPFVILLTVLLLRFFSRHSISRSDRTRSRPAKTAATKEHNDH